MQDKDLLRSSIREKRRRLNDQAQQYAAQNIFTFISPSSVFSNSQHIATYLPNDGEINPYLLVNLAWEQGKFCYLPIIDCKGMNTLKFARYTPETQFIVNRYNIPEPVHKPENVFDAHLLDLVLTPLVGFDNKGNRMGMGMGFYDRTFEFVRQAKTPFLMGLAHSCQQVICIEKEEWDIPLNGLTTEKSLRFFEE